MNLVLSLLMPIELLSSTSVVLILDFRNLQHFALFLLIFGMRALLVKLTLIVPAEKAIVNYLVETCPLDDFIV